MDITYPLLISEDIAQLQAAERAARDKTRTDRSGCFGFSRRGGRQSGRGDPGLSCAHRSALVAVLSRRRLGGAAGAGAAARHGGTHHAGSVGRLAGGDAGRPHRREAQIYLRDTWHIAYGIDAISKLFRRRKTKLKTGRPHHRNSPTDQAAFKK